MSRTILMLFGCILSASGYSQFNCNDYIDTDSDGRIRGKTSIVIGHEIVISFSGDSIEKHLILHLQDTSMRIERGSKAVFTMTDGKQVFLPVWRLFSDPTAPAYLVLGQAFTREWETIASKIVRSISVCTQNGFLTGKMDARNQMEFSLVLGCIIKN